jgi:hypothetical protein
MSGSKFTVSRGVVCERVGDELMIVVPGRTEVVKLTGEAADVFLDVQAGKTPHVSVTLTSELEALGIIEAAGMSRRGLIKAGAIGAGAGIAVLAMPSVAAANSSEEEAGPIQLKGSLFRDEEWTALENTNNPVIVETLVNLPVGKNSPLRYVTVTNPPYESPVPTNPPLRGSITVGGILYVAYLFDYVSDSNIISPIWAFLVGSETIKSFDPFALTFTFEDKEYSVTNR